MEIKTNSKKVVVENRGSMFWNDFTKNYGENRAERFEKLLSDEKLSTVLFIGLSWFIGLSVGVNLF